MGNFSKNLQKSNLLDQMQRQLNIAELAEARSVFMVACYEAMYGELPQAFLARVQTEVSKTNPKTKGDFYRSVFQAAQLVDQEIAIEEAAERGEANNLDAYSAAAYAEPTAGLAQAVEALVQPRSEDSGPQGEEG